MPLTIDDLFDEILEQFFLYLDFRDRLLCKTVCKRWLDILMTSPRFRSDRRLNFSECGIKFNRPPASIFFKSIYNYETIYIGKNVIVSGDPIKMMEFWKKMGESLKEICLPGTDVLMVDYWKELKRLKVVHFTNCDSYLKMNQLQDKQLSNVETLKFDTVDNIAALSENVATIKTFLPKLKQIIVENYELDLSKEYEEFPEIIKIRSCTTEMFEENPRGNRNPFLIQSLQTTYSAGPSLKEMHTQLYLRTIDNSVEYLKRITNMHIECRGSANQLVALNLLPNLRQLKIERYERGCPFPHTSLEVPSLKQLDITWKHLSCDNCLIYLSKSFVRLRRFSITVYLPRKLTPSNIWLIMNCSKLERLSISWGTHLGRIPIHEMFLNQINPAQPNTRLTHLDINGIYISKACDFVNLHKFFPNVIDLAFEYDGTQMTLHEVVLGVLPRFYLKRLVINSMQPVLQCDREALHAISHIVEHGKRLQKLVLPLKRIDESCIISDQFQGLEYLWSVYFGYNDRIRVLRDNALFKRIF